MELVLPQGIKKLSLDKDSLLNGADPVLDGDQFVPVIYDGNNWKIADTSKKWYDYSNQWWANAVILNSTASSTKKVGDTITVDGNNSDALAMFVWIPRYEYKIDGEYGTHPNGTAGTQQLPGEVKIKFISKTTTTASTGYVIHPAFTFGSEVLSGMWVGKFETGSSIASDEPNYLGCTNDNCSNADRILILPNLCSITYNNVSNSFFASRSMSRSNNPFGINKNNIDTHMMKNSEWGAVAYLSQSIYGKYGNVDYSGAQREVFINNSSAYVTGRSGGNVNGNTKIKDTYTDQTSSMPYTAYGFYTYDGYLLSYNTDIKTDTRDMTKGPGASTTGNIYGIYDMVGGAFEYTMGVFANSNGDKWSGISSSSNSGFTGKVGVGGSNYTGISFPNAKYYDVYKASSGTTYNEDTACNNDKCYGHAMFETKRWYGNYFLDPSVGGPWVIRGGYYYDGIGLFGTSDINGGAADSHGSFRMVLAPTL